MRRLIRIRRRSSRSTDTKACAFDGVGKVQSDVETGERGSDTQMGTLTDMV